jgi:hypothetical protein
LTSESLPNRHGALNRLGLYSAHPAGSALPCTLLSERFNPAMSKTLAVAKTVSQHQYMQQLKQSERPASFLPDQLPKLTGSDPVINDFPQSRSLHQIQAFPWQEKVANSVSSSLVFTTCASTYQLSNSQQDSVESGALGGLPEAGNSSSPYVSKLLRPTPLNCISSIKHMGGSRIAFEVSNHWVLGTQREEGQCQRFTTYDQDISAALPSSQKEDCRGRITVDSLLNP